MPIIFSTVWRASSDRQPQSETDETTVAIDSARGQLAGKTSVSPTTESLPRPTRFANSIVWFPNRSRFFVLTAVVAVHKLIAVTLCLADLVALFAVVEARVVLVVVPWWRWRWFGWSRNGNVTCWSNAATSDRAARSIMIVGSAVLSVLRAILIFLGGTVCRVVVFRWEDIVGSAATSLGWDARVATVLTRLEKETGLKDYR